MEVHQFQFIFKDTAFWLLGVSHYKGGTRICIFKKQFLKMVRSLHLFYFYF